MLKLYYSKGSSAVPAHILLEEVGADYEGIEISIPKGEQRSPAFLAVNPKGRVPVLETPDGILSENPAILEYIAATHPKAGFLPEGPFSQARARSLAAYLCATAHVAFAHLRRGDRWAREDASLQDMKAQVPGNLADCAAHLEQDLAFGPWAFGASYSFCDPYLLQVARWLDMANVPMDPYPGLAAHKSALLARPATRKVLAIHGLS